MAAEAGQGRILGLDAGERRIGVAISDPGRSFALPLNSIFVDGGEFARLDALIRDETVDTVVVGLPLSLSGESSAQTERARSFAREVESRFKVSVHLWDERLSSRQAENLTRGGDPSRGKGRGRERRGGRERQEADTDAVAASIILQAFLDSLRFGTQHV